MATDHRPARGARGNPLKDAPVPGVPAPRRAALLVAAWLVPGAGHAVLGRPARGASFLGIVALTFATGLALGGRLTRPDVGHPASFLVAAASYGSGLAPLLVSAAGGASRDVRTVQQEYGTTYLLVAGLMNLLLVLDLASATARAAP